MKVKEKREIIERIIDLCESVRSRGLDPFDVQVKELLEKLRELFPELKKLEELYLDMRAVSGLADVILHQSEWLKHRSSVLYLDPLLITLKMQVMEPAELAEIFTKCWHPILEMESISPSALRTGLDYWTELPPLSERGAELGGMELQTGRITEEELREMGILSEEEFSRILEEEWKKMLQNVGKRGISYWKWVCAKTFEETVRRSWIMSFLISYGYVDVEVMPLEEDIIIRPRSKPAQEAEPRTLVIPITYEEWRKHARKG
ncbi:MAG: hypothetical protein QXX33_03585 [Candidatus Hadarchaeales archaeon]